MTEWVSCPKCGALMIGLTGGHICPLCGYRLPVQTITYTTGTGKYSDYVEVIRCKDCKHYLEDSYGEDEWVMCRRTNLYTDGEKYCAWAERKEE